MFLSRYFGTALFSAAKTGTSPAAATQMVHNPLEQFFEVDRRRMMTSLLSMNGIRASPCSRLCPTRSTPVNLIYVYRCWCRCEGVLRSPKSDSVCQILRVYLTKIQRRKSAWS